MNPLRNELEEIYLRAYDAFPGLRPLLATGFAATRVFELPPANWQEARRDVLFLGIHPSHHTANGPAFNPDNHSRAAYAPFSHFTFDPFSPQTGGEEEAGYFRDIRQLIAEAGLDESDCAYLDLFTHRAANQETLRQAMASPGWTDFLCDQLRLADRCIREVVQPRILVVLQSDVMRHLGASVRPDGREPLSLGYILPEGLDPLLGLQRIADCRPAIPGIPPGPMPRSCHVLSASIISNMSRAARVRLAWTLARAHRLILLSGGEQESPVCRLLTLLECELPGLRMSRPEAVKPGQAEGAVKDRDAGRDLIRHCRRLLDELEQGR